MQPIQIKTYQTKRSYDELSLFVLSKGLNAGKPLTQPCPNCFVITAQSAQHKTQLRWICYMLWITGTFKRHLIGSVIQFIRISGLKDCLEQALMQADSNSSFEKLTQVLEHIAQQQQNLQLQIETLDLLKKQLIKRLLSST
jgi:hypothetical protein